MSSKAKGSVRGSRTGRRIMALLDLLGRRWTLRILWELPYTDLRSFSSRSMTDRGSFSRRGMGDMHPKTVVNIEAADREISHKLSPGGGKALVAILKRRAPDVAGSRTSTRGQASAGGRTGFWPVNVRSRLSWHSGVRNCCPGCGPGCESATITRSWFIRIGSRAA